MVGLSISRPLPPRADAVPPGDESIRSAGDLELLGCRLDRRIVIAGAPPSGATRLPRFPGCGYSSLKTGAQAMITRQDCIDLCGLDENEVAAISEHEHVPEIIAATLANYLLHQPRGCEAIRRMIIDDIHKALDEGRVAHATELLAALEHFAQEHP
jgi:hypothetical protein